MCLSSLPDGSVVQLGSDMFKMGHPLKVPLLSKNNCTLEGRAGGVWSRTPAVITLPSKGRDA